MIARWRGWRNVCTCVLALVVHSQSNALGAEVVYDVLLEDQTYRVEILGQTVLITAPGKLTTTIHLESLTEDDQNLYAPRSEFCKISPDGKYLPLILYTAPNKLDVLLTDLESGLTVRDSLIEGGAEPLLKEVEWINNSVFQVRYNWDAVGKTILYDARKRKGSFHIGEYGIVFSPDGDHYASVYNKSWYWTRGEDYLQTPPALGKSEVLRYDGYWVYPEPMEGFVSTKDALHLSSFSNLINARYNNIYHSGVHLEKTHLLSYPAFIGDSGFVGFWEWTFAEMPDGITVEADVVILKAENLSENPPRPESVTIRRRKVELDFGLSWGKGNPLDARYYDMRYNMHAVWNADTRELELWKSIGWNSEIEPRQKLATVDVDIVDGSFGLVTQLEADSSVRWSRF